MLTLNYVQNLMYSLPEEHCSSTGYRYIVLFTPWPLIELSFCRRIFRIAQQNILCNPRIAQQNIVCNPRIAQQNTLCNPGIAAKDFAQS